MEDKEAAYVAKEMANKEQSREREIEGRKMAGNNGGDGEGKRRRGSFGEVVKRKPNEEEILWVVVAR